MKTTDRDPNQCITYSHDHENCAQRVVIVGGFPGNSNPSSMSYVPPTQKEVQVVEVPKIVEVEKIVYVDKPYIVEKTIYEKIEVPVIVEKIEYREIQVPYGVQSNSPAGLNAEGSINIVERTIEKQVFIPTTEYKDLPIWVRVCFVAQALITIIMLLKHWSN